MLVAIAAYIASTLAGVGITRACAGVVLPAEYVVPVIDPTEETGARTVAEELEIDEYRQLKLQMDYLRKRFPTASSISRFNAPLIGSPAVITCDNTDFDKTHQNADRTGIVSDTAHVDVFTASW